MNWKIFFLTFISIFLAELGDKTQLATIAFTADNNKYKWFVFFGAAFALVLTSFLGVFFGYLLTEYIPLRYIKLASGILFLVIGILLIVSYINPAEKKYTKLTDEILRISKIEKCRYCIKFNQFLKLHNDNEEIKNLNLVVTGKLHNPLECEECNTEFLNEIEIES